MKIPLVDLQAQYRSIKDEIDEAMARVVARSDFIMGEDVGGLEEEFACFCGAHYAVGVSSGTDALFLSLVACGVKPGDEVITVPNTFIATAEAISRCGAVPIFVDIDSRTYNIDITKIEEKITAITTAILPVHLYGQPADMDPILSLAREYDLRVIEDAAQAHGAEYKGRRVGTLGDAAAFSFYPAKNLGCYGDGGMVVTNDESVAHRVCLLRDHGRDTKYTHLQVGYGHRLDTLQAAILRVKLRRLEEWNEQRRQHARLYDKLLEDLDVVTPYQPAFARSVFHLYVIRTAKRDQLRENLRAQGIACGIHYPLPLHLQPAYKHLGYSEGDFPLAEECAKGVLSLPMYPGLMEEQQMAVVEAIKRFFRSGQRGALRRR